MDSAEALVKINEIHRVIQGSNKAIFSGERLMVIGGVITLAPLLELGSQGLTFGYDLGSYREFISTFVHVAFYWFLCSAILKFTPFKKTPHEQQHPLIQKAFGMIRPFLVSIFGTVFILSYLNHGELIYPMVLIFVGLLYNLYGRFSSKVVTNISWCFIAFGFFCAMISGQQIPYLWAMMMVCNGLGYVAIGFFLRKAKISS